MVAGLTRDFLIHYPDFRGPIAGISEGLGREVGKYFGLKFYKTNFMGEALWIFRDGSNRLAIAAKHQARDVVAAIVKLRLRLALFERPSAAALLTKEGELNPI